jgi:hypothetical protein
MKESIIKLKKENDIDNENETEQSNWRNRMKQNTEENTEEKRKLKKEWQWVNNDHWRVNNNESKTEI